MKFHNITTYTSLLQTSNIEDKIKVYILDIVNRELSSSTMKIFLAAVKNFFEMNDIENIKWRKLKRFMGEKTPENEDRCYSHEEIQTLLNIADLRLKVTILLMASSGMRIGALPHLVLGHLERRGEIYKISVDKGQKGKGQYYTFCTPEAAKAIDTYLEFRKRCGEKIEPGSPLFRKEFDVDFHEGARNRVESASIHSLRMDVFNSLVNSGLRIVDRINSSRKRKEVKMTHGFRKFFETMLVNTNLHETIIRKLTGHSQTGNLTQLYSKQTEAEMLHEYEKAIDALTIDPANRLRKRVEKLEVEKTQIQALALELEKVKKAIGSK